MNQTTEASKPWYKEFWAWFVFTPLIVVIIACSFTVTLAFKYKDDVVDDDYYKVGKMINNGFAPDQRAKALALDATLEYVDGRFIVELKPSEWLPDDVLILSLSHPFKKELDAFITLDRVDDLTWQSSEERPAESKWYLKLMAIDDDGAEVWRLHGEMKLPQDNTVALLATSAR